MYFLERIEDWNTTVRFSLAHSSSIQLNNIQTCLKSHQAYKSKHQPTNHQPIYRKPFHVSARYSTASTTLIDSTTGKPNPLLICIDTLATLIKTSYHIQTREKPKFVQLWSSGRINISVVFLLSASLLLFTLFIPAISRVIEELKWILRRPLCHPTMPQPWNVPSAWRASLTTVAALSSSFGALTCFTSVS